MTKNFTIHSFLANKLFITEKLIFWVKSKFFFDETSRKHRRARYQNDCTKIKKLSSHNVIEKHLRSLSLTIGDTKTSMASRRDPTHGHPTKLDNFIDFSTN